MIIIIFINLSFNHSNYYLKLNFNSPCLFHIFDHQIALYYLFVLNLPLHHLLHSTEMFSLATFNDTINFHIPLIGLPLKGLIFFHKPISNQDTLIYTATEKNILAAINCKNVWRQEFSEDDHINIIKPLKSKIITFSNSSIVRAWNALTGFLIWEEIFSNPFLSNKYNIDFFENNVTSNTDIIVLTSNTIYSLDSNTGFHIWNYHTDLKMFPLCLSISNPFIYLIESPISSDTYSLSVLKLDGKTGNKILSNYISLISKLDDIIYVGTSSLPIIVWKKFNTNITHIIKAKLPFDSVKFYAPEYSNPTSSILVQFISNSSKKTWADIFFLNSSSILKLYEISSVSASSVFFSTTYMSSVFFIHSFVNKFGSITLNIYNNKNDSILNTWNISLNQSYNFYLDQIISKIFQKTDKSIAAKFIIVTQDGSIHMIQEASILWTREESLAYSIHGEFLSLPQKKIISIQNNISFYLSGRNAISEIISLEISNKITRLVMLGLGSFQNNFRSITQLSFGIEVAKHIQLKKEIEAYDPVFTFLDCQLLKNLNICFNLNESPDSLYNAEQPVIFYMPHCPISLYESLFKENWSPKKLCNIFLIGNCLKTYDLTMYYILYSNCMSRKLSKKKKYPFVFKACSSIDALKINLLGNTSNVFPISALNNLSNIYFSTKDSNTLKGYFINFKNLYVNTSWNIDFPPSKSIISLSVKNKNEKIASIGRVLGDRSVLYKYLNSHFLAVATGNRIDSKLDIYLIDIVKGMILYTSHYNEVDISKGVQV
ncbi:hypothetical protein PCK2_000573, partial [Pneumocystis canis]